MTYYTLYNKRLERQLQHPEVGLWYTPDFAEAQDMLKACREYVVATGLADLVKDFVIVDAETGEEVTDEENVL